MKKFLSKISTKQKMMILLIIAIVLDALDIVLGRMGIVVLFRGEFFLLKLYALVFVTYKFLNILTGENKTIAKFGTFFICFSTAVLARINFDLITLGELFVIFLNRFYDNSSVVSKEKNPNTKKVNHICILGMIISAISFIISSDFSLQFSLIYVFIALAIWTILKQDKKIWKKSFLVTFISLIVLYGIYILIGRFTALYGIENQEENNISLTTAMFSYPFSFLMPYTNFANKTSYYSLLNLFPLPLILAGIYSFKNDNSKHDYLFIPMMFVTVFEIVVFNIMPNVVKVYTGIGYSTIIDIAFAIGLLNMYLLYYIWGNIKETMFKKQIYGIYLILGIVIVMYFAGGMILGRKYMYLYVVIGTLLDFLAINYDKPKYVKATMWIYTILTLWGIPALFL